MDPLISAVLATRGKHPRLPENRHRPRAARPSARLRRGDAPALIGAAGAGRHLLRPSLRGRAAAALRWAADQLDAGARSRGVPQQGSST